jgi:antirestriction protein ArdC
MAKSDTKFNIYDHVTETIIAQIEAGTVPWRKPWTGSKAGFGMPLRITGEAYRGINVLMLWMAAQDGEYASSTWMTYKQAKDLGGQVRKGEKSTTVIKYGTIEDRSSEGEGADAQTRSYARAYSVFNCDQIDGLAGELYTKLEQPRDIGTQTDPALDAWFARLEIPLDTTNEPAAYYTPSSDHIHMPPIGTFKSTAGYYSTLFHESAHATKHADRLDRKHPGIRGEQYSREELVADITAAMVSARHGLTHDYAQTAAYLEHWVEILGSDNRAIIRAASMAQAAADWMFNKAGRADHQPQTQIAA